MMPLQHPMRFVYAQYPWHRRRLRGAYAGDTGGRRLREEWNPAWSGIYPPVSPAPTSSSLEDATSSPKEGRSPEHRGQEFRGTETLYSAAEIPYRCAHCKRVIYERHGQNQIREKCTSCTHVNFCSDCFVEEKHLPRHASHTFINVHSYPHNTKLRNDYIDIEVERVLFPIQRSILQKYTCFHRDDASQFTHTIKILKSKPLWVWNTIWTWLRKPTPPPTDVDEVDLDRAPRIELPEKYSTSKNPALLGKGKPVVHNAVILYGVTKQLKLSCLNALQAKILRDEGKMDEDPVAILRAVYDRDDEQLRQWAKVFVAAHDNAKKMVEVKEWKAGLLALFKKDGRAAMDFVEALVAAKDKDSRDSWWSREVAGGPEWMCRDGHLWHRDD